VEDLFDDRTLERLLTHVTRHNVPLRFADIQRGALPERFVLVRHDVDYSPEAALRIASLEAARGLRASYFLLLGSDYYNLLSGQHAGFPRSLVALGHEVGLHYDVRLLRAFPRESWAGLLRGQAALLGELSGAPVVSVAMHQPGLHGLEPPSTQGFLDAYEDRFFREIEYVSDSCRAWRDRGWAMVSGGPVTPRLQLVLHPVNWGARDAPRGAIYEGIHLRRRRELRGLGRELQAQIAVHEGVLEHEARRTRGGDGAEGPAHAAASTASRAPSTAERD
jgi:hypothetical protein